MRKISSEARLALQFDKDLIASLLLLKNCIIKSENESIAKSRVVKGFIQHIHASPFSVICFNEASRRDSVPYAALYIAPILIDTRLHSTRGQFFIRHECGACIRLRTNTSLIRMISRSAYGFKIFVITCLHTSDERVQTLYTSCIRIVSNPFSVLHT